MLQFPQTTSFRPKSLQKKKSKKKIFDDFERTKHSSHVPRIWANLTWLYTANAVNWNRARKICINIIYGTVYVSG